MLRKFGKLSRSSLGGELQSFSESEIEHEQKRFVLRASPRPATSLSLKAAAVAPPPTVQPVLA